MQSNKPKIIVQFNEANFDLIEEYCKNHDLVGFKKILKQPTKFKTTSEDTYENLEPWIQWYSFYTNMPFDQHRVFHLGDCLKNNHSNFIEDIADQDHKVGIFGSMNLKPSNKYNIYIPDAWTESKSDGSFSSKLVHKSTRYLVNNNARLKINLSSILGLIILVGFPNKIIDIKMIFKAFRSVIDRSRSKLASILDYYFMKYATSRIKKKSLDYSLIFLNGFAHVQHHYLLSSSHIEGSNPEWYVKKKDPVLSAIKIYDDMFNKLFQTCENKFDIWIITGLTQVPYSRPIYYWRFRNHSELIRNFIDFDMEIFPRMTRDFEISLKSNHQMKTILDFLENSTVSDINSNGRKAFSHIDVISDKRVFASFVYDGNGKQVFMNWGSNKINLEDSIDFIAIKNGHHNENGWVYSNAKVEKNCQKLPIWEVSRLIAR